jgi:hypothetical protein
MNLRNNYRNAKIDEGVADARATQSSRDGRSVAPSRFQLVN